MRGIMSGLEPRRYADGDLVEEEKGFFSSALDFAKKYGVLANLPYAAYTALTDPEELKDTYKKSHDFGKDYIFDYTDPVEYATLPLYLAGPAGAAANKSIKAGRVANKINKAGKTEKILDNKATKGILNIGGPVAGISADIALDPEIDFGDVVDAGKYYGTQAVDYVKDIFTNDALDDAAEDLEMANADEIEKPDAMKGIAAFAKFASQLGATPGETEEMTGGQFIPMRPFEAPGVMRMADGGIAQLAKGGRVGALISGIKALAKKVTPKKKTKTKKKADKEKETAISKDAPEGPGALDFVDPYTASAIRAAATKASDLASATRRNIKPIAGTIGTYGTIGGLGYGLGSALLGGDEETTETDLGPIATGGGDKDVLDADSSLRDFNYAKALERAQAAGRTEPTFVDYVASFPASYTDKLGKDPEFAKQMMAGFVAMMTPTEGIVERSGLADFAGGVMAEQARQEGEVPDQIKLLEAIKENPEILKAMRQLNAETADPSADAKNAVILKQQILKQLYGEDYDDDDVVLDSSTGQELSDLQLLQMYKDSGGNYDVLRANIMAKVKV